MKSLHYAPTDVFALAKVQTKKLHGKDQYKQKTESSKCLTQCTNALVSSIFFFLVF